ncbi:zinc finger E-box-binding homeobox 2a isoform X1 [Nothobranchius furzeri]
MKRMMAEGPRCKRRKQANPRRKNALNYDIVLETPSETDEEDKMPLCDDNSSTGGGRRRAGEEAGSPSPVSHATLSMQENPDQHQEDKNLATHLHSISELDDYFLKQKLEDGDSTPPTITEYLQRSSTAIIYPEAPEEAARVNTPEAAGHEESENDPLPTTDDFAQLLTCPYCHRGYKRLTSLKEHIKYRHEGMDERLSCLLCSESFTHRAQLERHMTSHRSTMDQLLMLSEGTANRKFKCSECGKAFKYKHHLKEHLRIHSGEKPYECSNCKKRFSHSGSYSSHISSKKCVGLIALHGRVRNGKPGTSPSSKISSPGSPALSHLQHKLENVRTLGSKDQHSQLDLNEYRLLMASQYGFGVPDICLNGRSRSPLDIHSSSQSSLQHLGDMGLDLSLLGYTVPLGNSLSDVQKVLPIVDNTVCRQRTDSNPEQLSKLRTYMKELGAHMDAQAGFNVGQSNLTKSIIDNTPEKVSEAKNLISESKMQLNVKEEKTNQSVAILNEEKFPDAQNQLLLFSCQHCKETFPGPIPLHQHERYLCSMNEEIKAILQPAENSPTSCRGLITDTDKPRSPNNHFNTCGSVLNSYFAMKTEPNSEELLKISIAIGLPQEAVKESFAEWKSQNHDTGGLREQLSLPNHSSLDHSLNQSSVSLSAINLHDGFAKSDAIHRLTKANHFTANEKTTVGRPLDPTDHSRSNTSSPLNLSSISSKHSQSSSYTPNSLTPEDVRGDIPLDLSLPKHLVQKKTRLSGFITEHNVDVSGYEHSTGPLDFVSIKEVVLGSRSRGNSHDQLEKNLSPIFGINPFTGGSVYNTLQPNGVFPPPTFLSASQATIPGFRPFPGLDTMGFLPHVAYSYATGAATFAEVQQQRKYQRKAGFQGELLDGTTEYLSGVDDLTDSDTPLSRKKIRKTESGMYACDLCDKTFQKTSSLLRHKYEHTGKRPHQCQICKKAFKHKHHLIEHSRLHSGEKPYQCDKCGKRFSHSGSYSQHMNHRYSYCKREAEEREAAQREARNQRGLEPTELLLGGGFLQDLGSLGYSDSEDQMEDNTILGDSGDGGGGQERGEVKEGVTDQQQSDNRSHFVMDMKDKDSMQQMEECPPDSMLD